MSKTVEFCYLTSESKLAYSDVKTMRHGCKKYNILLVLREQDVCLPYFVAYLIVQLSICQCSHISCVPTIISLIFSENECDNNTFLYYLYPVYSSHEIKVLSR